MCWPPHFSFQWGEMLEKMTPIWSQLSSMIDDKQGTNQMEKGVKEGGNPPDSDYLHLPLEISLSRHLEQLKSRLRRVPGTPSTNANLSSEQRGHGKTNGGDRHSIKTPEVNICLSIFSWYGCVLMHVCVEQSNDNLVCFP